MYVEEDTLIVKATLQDDGMEVRVPAEHVSKGLVRDDHAREKRPTGGLMVELSEDIIDQSRDISEKPTIATEERAQRFGHCEYELAMW